MTEKLNNNENGEIRHKIILNQLASEPEFACLTELQVQLIENKIHFKLPQLYRYLLKNLKNQCYNSINFKYSRLELEFSGSNKLVDNTKLENDLDFNLSYFRRKPFNFPSYIFPIGYIYESDYPYCFDLSQMKDGDCPVFEFNLYYHNWDAPRTGEYAVKDDQLDGYFPDYIANTFEEFMNLFISAKLDETQLEIANARDAKLKNQCKERGLDYPYSSK